jgi:hypothetical protein
MIKDGLKQPHQIKMSFTMNGKELTRFIAPDQACLGPKFFLAQKLPNFESKIVSHLSANNETH